MIKKVFLKIIIVLGLISFSACSIGQKDEVGIMGYVKDELGNPLTNVSISYRTSLVSVQTDTIGGFNINAPRTLFIDFKKEGYHPLSTKINNFSEEASYNFNTIILKKTDTPNFNYKDISLNTNPNFKNLKIYGNVLNSFKEPLNKVNVTLIDSIKASHSLGKYGNKNGFFHFKKQWNLITFKREGFKELLIGFSVYKKDSQNITLLENANKKGIYIIKGGKYKALPQMKLSHTSEKKNGRILWGGNFTYDVTDFFYPEKTTEFKIETDSIIRFVIYEPYFSSILYKAADKDGYLCTVSYKISTSPLPKTGETVPLNIIYPPKYSKGTLHEPRILEFKSATTNSNYVFVNAKNKKGYYFTY